MMADPKRQRSVALGFDPRSAKAFNDLRKLQNERRKLHKELNSEEFEEMLGKKRLRERYEATQRKPKPKADK